MFIHTIDAVNDFFHETSWQGSRLGLERMTQLMALLGDPQKKLRFVHITGTNGKGSTAAMLAAILTQAGYVTGLYTSPHLVLVNERMKINGQDVSDADLISLAAELQPAVAQMEDPPTEFERITALALLYFYRKKCDLVVLEVGLGGRLDATNVIPAPEAAVITNIGLEHTAVLGNTRAQIAREKAGILKPGTAAVLYHQSDEVEDTVRAVCREKGIPLCITDPSQGFVSADSLDGQILDYRDRRGLKLCLLGPYQQENAFAALDTVDVLRARGWRIPSEAVERGLAAVQWPGRFEILRRDPLVIVDGAHNPNGVEALRGCLSAYFPEKKLTFVMGVMADKDYLDMLEMLAPFAGRFITVTPENERALPSRQLAEQIWERFRIPALDGGSVQDGLSLALTLCGPEDVICALGSLYQAGAVRSYFLSRA